MTIKAFETEIKQMVKAGIVNQHELFNRMYPLFTGHYAELRELIAKVKNDVSGS